MTATPLPPELLGFMVRSAAEGVPVGAIARMVRLPYDRVLHCLQRARRLGAITSIPKPDWPANQTTQDRAPLRTPSNAATIPHEECEFLCRHIFRLTNLEAGFLAVLLRTLFAEKEKLHAVIEQQRTNRPLRPLQGEVTNIKMVDVMVCKLRKKLARVAPDVVIRTSWGKGYFLDQPVKDGIYRMLDVGVGDFSHDLGTQPLPTGRRAGAAHVPA